MVRLNEIRTGEWVVDIALPTDAAIAFIGRVTPLAPRQPGDDEVGDPDDNSVLPLQHDANGRCKRKVLMKLSARNRPPKSNMATSIWRREGSTKTGNHPAMSASR